MHLGPCGTASACLSPPLEVPNPLGWWQHQNSSSEFKEIQGTPFTNYQLYCPWKLASLWDRLCYLILSLAYLRRYLVASLNYLDYSRAVYIVEDLLLSPTCRLVHVLHYRHLGLIYPVVPTDLTAFLLTQLDRIGYCIGMTVLYWTFPCNNNLSIFPIFASVQSILA